ncbi:MAG: Ppx/GppA phosphatase family protein [Solirubrobacteraceae bacterium]
MTRPTVAACVDIGSNTTRLLVAERSDGTLREVAVQRQFLHLACGPGGEIAPHEVRELALTVADHVALAREHGCQHVAAVATAALRDARNREALCEAVRAEAGVAIEVLSEAEEAALAFAGATAGLGGDGLLGVLDVGGGSSELVCGTVAEGVAWWASIPLGSGILTERHVRSDPPTAAELAAIRAEVGSALAALEAPPRPQLALAVGGSAMSLRRVAGETLTAAAIEEALEALAALPAAAAARHFGVDPRRARLMPAGLLVLRAAWEVFGGMPLHLAGGGLREGVLLRELAGGS